MVRRNENQLLSDVRKGVEKTMKIDEPCIDHNAVRLIKELVDTRYDMTDLPDIMKMTIGEIGGILEMAKAMKEVLKCQ